MDEIDITTSFDPVNPTPDQDQYLQWVGDVISTGIQEKNIYIPLNSIKHLGTIIKLSGLMLAKFFYEVDKHWDEFEPDMDKDNLHEYVGYHERTVQRYIRIWKMLTEEEIPEKPREILTQHNPKDLVPIAQLVEDGYILNNHEWEQLADAANFYEISAIVRKIRGVPPRKNAIIMSLEKNGEIVAFTGDGDRYLVGYLRIDQEEDVVQKSIERIIRHSGIIKR